MAITGGRQVEVGLGMEATAGTPVASTITLKWNDLSVQGVSEKVMLTSARGVRQEASQSVIKRKMAKGSLAVVPDVESAPYFLKLALGTLATAIAEAARHTGTATSTSAGKLVDTSGSFIVNGVLAGDAVHNTTNDTWAVVVTRDSATQLTITPDIMTSGNAYTVSSGVYNHTISTQEANASMKTATILVKEGGIQTERFSNVVCDKLTIEASDEFASMTMDLLGKFPDTTTLTPAYTTETVFAYSDMTVKFGTDLTAAASASATKLKSLSLEINNNIQTDEAFLSGSNDIAAGMLIAGPRQVKGSYSLQFSDTVELAKYKVNTLNAMIVDFTGAAIGAAEHERIKIKLAAITLTKEPIEYNIDGIVILTQDFTALYDATTSTDISAIITNETNPNSY